MGEISEAMRDGTLCQVCGEYLGGDEGYPVICGGCGGEPYDYSDEPYKKYSNNKGKRAEHRDEAPKLLKKNGIHFESKNGGAHLIVTGSNGLIDFWPSKGKWKVRLNGGNDVGIEKLIKYIKG